MGAIIENQQLINGFVALMAPGVSRVRGISEASQVARKGRLELSALPLELRNFINAQCSDGNLADRDFAKLYAGDCSDYLDNNGEPDKSRGDSHFIQKLGDAGFTPDECDQAYRTSGLYRAKWDSPRGNSTYGANTIADAFSRVKTHSTTKQGTLPTEKTPRLKLADGLLTFSNDLPPPRDFVIGDLILAAKSALLAGLGGVSKSQLLLQMAICTVSGLPFMRRVTTECAALLLFGEEDAEELSRRVNAIAKVMRLSAEQLGLVQKRLRAFPMVGLDTRLTKPLAGALEGSGFAQEIIAAAKELEAECGLPVRLIGLDHLGLIHGGDFNAREDAVQTMRQVNYIAQETGAATIVLAHSPKASISKDAADAADVAGSAGFVDQSRGVYILRTMDDAEGKQYGIDPDQRKNYVALRNVKANYTRHGDVIWMKREVVEGYEVSVLMPVELHVPVKVPKGSDYRLRAAIFELVKEKPYLAKDSLLGFAGAKDGRLRASKATVSAELEIMLAEGILAFRDPTDEERKRMGIKGKTHGFLTTSKPIQGS